MEQHEQQLRHAAAEAFMDSLEQLSQSLQNAKEAVSSNPTEANPSSKEIEQKSQSSAPAIDLAMLEEAAADIEAFIRSQSLERSS